jgi:RNA polymerase sigma factor (sigma-70 family)
LIDRELQFEQIVRDHEALVFRTLARLLGRSEHLEDLAQEVFFRLYRALDHFRHEAKLSTYLYRIIVNVAQDEWKRRRLERQMTCSLSDPDEQWEERLSHRRKSVEGILQEKQVWQEIESALGLLSQVERSVLVLYHQEERTYEAIALILDLPIGTVRTHLHRGRKKLRSILRQRMPAYE